MNEKGDHKGVLVSTVTAWCGLCGDWQEFDCTATAAPATAREDGWRKHKQLGWLCPECAQAKFDELPTRERVTA